MAETDVDVMHVLRSAVHEAARRQEVRAAVKAVYRDLAAEVEERRPVCVVSGRCCRFEEYGHRLYVTTMELAAFVHGLEATSRGEALSTSMNQWNGAGCPFQISKLCGVHAIRPFGCRIYFCDPTSTRWQQDAYELFHARLKRLHEELDVPYYYVEWRQALRAILKWPTA
jgi:Fe-S-cluster containining protein